MVWQTAGLGVALSLGLAAAFGALRGPEAATAAGLFGGLGTAIQTGAVALMRPAIGREAHVQFRRFGAGMGLRLLGVVAIPVAVLADRAQFAPVPTAFGYLGVIVPLLFFETRLFK